MLFFFPLQSKMHALSSAAAAKSTFSGSCLPLSTFFSSSSSPSTSSSSSASSSSCFFVPNDKNPKTMNWVEAQQHCLTHFAHLPLPLPDHSDSVSIPLGGWSLKPCLYGVVKKKVNHKLEEKMHSKVKMTSQRAENLVHVKQHHGKHFYKKIFF